MARTVTTKSQRVEECIESLQARFRTPHDIRPSFFFFSFAEHPQLFAFMIESPVHLRTGSRANFAAYAWFFGSMSNSLRSANDRWLAPFVSTIFFSEAMARAFCAGVVFLCMAIDSSP